MDALKAIVAVALAATPLPATARGAVDPVARWQPYIAEASARFGVPESWIVRVMRAESGGRTMLNGRPIRSTAGAMGLMQLMPATWAELRTAYDLGADPDDPRANILAGTAYLRIMYDRFGHPGLFAAYNVGPGRYAAYLAGRQRLPAETVGYLAHVAGGQDSASSGPSQRAGEALERPSQRLFAVHSMREESGVEPQESAAENVLFFVRRNEK